MCVRNLVNVLWIASSLLVGQSLEASDEDTRFVAGLRERRLFSLAETYCNERLSDEQLAAVDRVQITVELVRTHAEHALNSRGSQRDSLWQKAHDIAAAFGETEQPQAILVRVQSALTMLARGELARMESEVATQSDEALTSARETLRQAAASLTAIDRELSETIPIRRRNPLRPTELSAEELVSLQNHVRYQLARAYKNQALCFPATSSDRTASLTAAIDQLDQPLRGLAPGQSLYVDLRLEQIICLRLLGDTDGAAGYLKVLRDVELSPDDQLRVRAERIHWHLARKEATEALQVVGEGRRIASTTSSAVDFAFLETYISLWKSAADNRDQEQAARWRDKSIAAARFVEQEHGPYWARRAEILLVRIGAASGDGSVEILRRTADELYRNGSFDAAIAAYDKAAIAATKAEGANQSFELAYKAALVVQQQKQFAKAVARFQRLALAQEMHADAVNAHLLAIANTRQASAAAGEWLDSYPELLREHLANWPDSDSASTAAFWLGEFEAGRRKWRSAIEALLQVQPDSEQYASAVRELLDLSLHLTKMTDAASGSARTDLAKLAIDVAKRLDSQRAEFNDTQRLSVDRGLAKALAATDDADAAHELFARLAKDHPNHAAIQEEYAHFLLDSDQDEYKQPALDQWRRVAARSRPRTARWFRAKYSVALAQYNLGDKQGSAKLIRYLQATEDLERSGLEEEFTELLARCSE